MVDGTRSLVGREAFSHSIDIGSRHRHTRSFDVQRTPPVPERELDRRVPSHSHFSCCMQIHLSSLFLLATSSRIILVTHNQWMLTDQSIFVVKSTPHSGYLQTPLRMLFLLPILSDEESLVIRRRHRPRCAWPLYSSSLLAIRSILCLHRQHQSKATRKDRRAISLSSLHEYMRAALCLLHSTYASLPFR